MAELQARFENLEMSAQSLWRYPIPEGKEVTIGRRSQTDLDVPDWNRSDWVVDDPRISGRHVLLNWDGKTCRVRRRLEPADRPAINPVFYRGKTHDDFQLLPGESFTIGSTTFTLQIRPEHPPHDVSEPELMTRTMAREELRASSFIDAKTPLMALADLPEIIRSTRDDVQLEERLLDIIIKALPLADFAGFVQIDPKGGLDARAAITRSKQRGLTGEAFRVSNRLVRHATREIIESVLVVWDKKSGDGSSKFEMTITPGTDWAICTPLDERPNQYRALYVAGRVPRNFVNDSQLKTDPEFLDYQKFINLAAELFCTMRDMFRMGKQNILLREFLPRQMLSYLDQQNLKEMLIPKNSDVTALFCDLRGSSMFAQNETDMLASWSRIKSALQSMTRAIYTKKGIIGGLFGDAAVGFWGWPNGTAEQIDQAIDAALDIRMSFASDRELQRVSFGCGIGLAHGPAVVGSLGTFQQFKLDAYGTVMNLASRLESLTKVYGVEILVNDVVAARLNQSDPEHRRARVRSMGKVRPAGMSIRVPVFELMPPVVDCIPAEAAVSYGSWDVGIKAFVDGNWGRARQRLEQFRMSLLDERRKIEKAADFFIDYIDQRNGNPPEKWDGTIEIDFK